MLTSNLHDTEELDLLELHLTATKINAEYVIKETEEADEESDPEDLKLACDALEGAEVALGRHVKDASTPTVLLGYIPVRKLTGLRHRSNILHRKGFDPLKATLDEREEFDDIARLYLRWGIKGHVNLGVDFETEEELCGSRKVTVASWEMVDIYEGLGLLYLLYSRVREFNTLAVIKKKEFLLSAGTTPQNSTVTSADKSPS